MPMPIHPAPLDKAELYGELAAQLRGLLANEEDLISTGPASTG
jgi:hypothetical protein